MKNYNFSLISIIFMSCFFSPLSAMDSNFTNKHLAFPQKLDTYSRSVLAKKPAFFKEDPDDWSFWSKTNNPLFLAIAIKDYSFALEILPELIDFQMFDIIHEKIKWSHWAGGSSSNAFDMVMNRRNENDPQILPLIEMFANHVDTDALFYYIQSALYNTVDYDTIYGTTNLGTRDLKTKEKNAKIVDILFKAAKCEGIEQLYTELKQQKATADSDRRKEIEFYLQAIHNHSYSKNCKFD